MFDKVHVIVHGCWEVTLQRWVGPLYSEWTGSIHIVLLQNHHYKLSSLKQHTSIALHLLKSRLSLAVFCALRSHQAAVQVCWGCGLIRGLNGESSLGLWQFPWGCRTEASVSWWQLLSIPRGHLCFLVTWAFPTWVLTTWQLGSSRPVGLSL